MDPSLHELLQVSFNGGASDVFLLEGECPRVRQDGEVIKAHGEPLEKETIAAIWRECGVDPQTGEDADASFVVEGVGRLRVNAYRSLGRIGVVMRPIKSQIPGFGDLGLPGYLLQQWLVRRSGLILICGPTGAGKSTTVAACLEWINQHRACHIVTLEDPIEYLFVNQRSYFSQREMGRDTSEFSHALRQALRQNPDVIFFGEIRDSESALAALRAAETGHLVISTLHAAGVSGVPVAIERLTRMLGSAMAGTSYLLSTQLIGVMAQQLLPRIDGGVVAMLEYFENSGITRKLIGDQSASELRDHLDRSESDAACPFLRYLVAATRQNIISVDIARAACDRPQDFDRAMRGITS
ncbi:twitching motility protein PilT [Haloferula luteola]|uniref:Twitching motility protein PilT n=1 Tax=Haloferula luteola TaxID=595692 RepID=A0A840V018_9BACT|nr:ATPase, T2SS/T4P/T4SS family [Haloferula luteola]MBB5351707.1 twitching motility protein PilT [Haloferula luteola]